MINSATGAQWYLFTASQPSGTGFKSEQNSKESFISNLRISKAIFITVDQQFAKIAENSAIGEFLEVDSDNDPENCRFHLCCCPEYSAGV